MPALKYAEALGSGLGILSGIGSWAGIQSLEKKCALSAKELLSRVKDCNEADLNSVWIEIAVAALHARVRRGQH